MSNELHTEKLVNDLKSVARDAEELIEATAGNVSEKAKEARGRLYAALASARASCEALGAKAVEGAKVTDRAIREHPYESLGIVFGLGFLIGVLVTRRDHD